MSRQWQVTASALLSAKGGETEGAGKVTDPKVGAHMHFGDEIGHNLAFSHSGEEGNYDDQSGFMGFSYHGHDGPSMCFNAAKSYQSDWYRASTVVVSPATSGGVNLQTCFSGELYGLADYDGDGEKTVLVKVDTNSSSDYFVSSNRRTGFNSQTQEGGDQVTIAQAGGEGVSYSQSTLTDKLGAGQSHVMTDFEGSGSNVVVSVDWIDTDRDPGVAYVRIGYDGAACIEASSMPSNSISPSTPPTSTPSQSPSSLPSSAPSDSSAPTNTVGPSSKPSGAPSSFPSHAPSQAPSSVPSEKPSVSSMPSNSIRPSSPPSSTPSQAPSSVPSNTAGPSSEPSSAPSSLPSHAPSNVPSSTSMPSEMPSVSAAPSSQPSMVPTETGVPSLQPSNPPSV
ncbi:hypothetical protein ACHAWF_003489, partial [Thalassiosira exigua]